MNGADVNPGGAVERPWRLLIAAYGAFVLACITLLHSTVLEMINLWAGSSSWRHGFFVAPIVLWMIYDRRHSAPRPMPSVAANALVFAAAFLWLAGSIAGIALIEQFAFISILIAGAAVIFGLPTLHAFAFPLAFLYFMVPFGEIMVPSLQAVTASGAATLLQLTGMAITPAGFLIETPNGVFDVATACAGLNFLLVAIMASTFIAYAWIKSWPKRIMFVAAAIAAAIVTNILRVFLVILLAGVTPEEWRIASDHFSFGLALYAAMIAILLAAGLRLAGPSTKQGG